MSEPFQKYFAILWIFYSKFGKVTESVYIGINNDNLIIFSRLNKSTRIRIDELCFDAVFLS